MPKKKILGLFGGAPAKARAYMLRTEGNADLIAEIDGGINGETAHLAVKAGADVLVAGSYLFTSEMKERMDYLKSL